MSAGRNNVVWALAGMAALGVVMFLAFRMRQQGSPSQQVELRAEKIVLADQLRVGLASAAEAEKSAVLAITDEESVAFADQARAATATVEQKRTALGALLQTSGTPQEKELLDQFSTAFAEFQRVDKELLELAVKNTNLKAAALAYGPAAAAIHEMDGALSHLLTANASASAGNAKKVMLLAAGAQAAALRIQALLPPHIAEESDKRMDELEARMSQEDGAVQNDLKELAALTAKNADVALAAASYARFTAQRTQILKLSRENTNVRSLAISLNQKRKVTVQCQDALQALAKMIEGERIPGVDNVPVSPR